MKKIVKICLLLSYIVQNFFHFDEIFIMKKFVKLCLHLNYTIQNYFHFDEIFKKFQFSAFVTYAI